MGVDAVNRFSDKFIRRHALTDKSFKIAQRFAQLIDGCSRLSQLEKSESRTWATKREYIMLHRDLYRRAAREYYHRNKEKCLASTAQWKLQNKERNAFLHRRWREENRDRKNTTTREWEQRNPEKVAAIDKRYYEKNRERKKAESAEWKRQNRTQYLAYARGYRRGLRGEELKNYVNQEIRKHTTENTPCKRPL